MRKAIYLGAALAAVMTTSCSNDMDQFGTTTGDGNVVIQLQLPDNLATRAFGDGTTATNLKYAVYHSGETNVVTQGTATFNGLQATVNLNLVNGKSYDFIFWADNDGNSFYTFDADNQTVTVDYDGLKGNDETRDAFFGQLINQEITGPATLSATLKRPFAQINLGTSDFDEVAVKAAYPVFSSSMTISTTLPTTLNLLDGNVSGATETVVTTSENRPDGETFPVNGYDYVSMNYILVDAAKDVIDLTFSFKNDGTQISNLSVASVPVQRNYRTNIYGAVFTSPTDLTITIEPNFNNPDFNNTQVVSTTEDFVNALNNPMITEIELEAPIDLSDVNPENMIIASNKILDLTSVVTEEGEAVITLAPQNPFDIKDGGSLTINGGTITNGQDELGAGQPVSMFHVRKDSELNLNGVTINGNTTHHYHGSAATGLNSAAIDYWDNAVINITDSYIKTGEFVVCGMGDAVGSKMTFINSYMESTSSSGYGTNNWSYAFRLHGGEATFKDCTVVGIQGGVSGGRGATITIESGTYYTHNNPGKKDAYYAVYMTGGSTAVINSGYFYGANMHSTLAGKGGTSAVVCGDNDTNQPTGFVVINGGYFSGMPYNHETKQTYEPAEGFKFVEIDETFEGRKYIWNVVKENSESEN